jgi:hypothetical protein
VYGRSDDARKNMIGEYWLLEALDSCHDILWWNAERGDQRAVEKKDALVLRRRNPGKFKLVEILAPQEDYTWKRTKVDDD